MGSSHSLNLNPEVYPSSEKNFHLGVHVSGLYKDYFAGPMNRMKISALGSTWGSFYAWKLPCKVLGVVSPKLENRRG